MADEEIRLLLDVKGAGAVADLQESLAYTRSTLEQLKAAYNAGEITVEQYLKTGGKLARQEQDLAQTLAAVDAEQQRLNADLLKALGAYDAVDHAMEEMESTAKRTASAVRNVAAAAGETGSRSQAAARGLVDISRGLEDFSTGGFVGVMNNLPGMVTNLGQAAGISAAALGGLTAGVSLLATGAYVLYRNWDSVTGLFEDRNPFPKAAKDIEGLKKEVEKAKEKLEEMEKAGSGTAKQIEEYNRLRRETAENEKRIADEMDRQKDLKDVLESKSKEQTERGSAFMTAVAGRGEQLKQDLIEAETKRAEFEIAQQKRLMDERIQKFVMEQHTLDEEEAFIKDQQARFESFKRTAKTGIPELIDGLIVQLQRGEEQGFRRLKALMDAGTGVVIGGSGFRAKLESELPEGKQAAKAREEAAKAKEAADKLAAEQAEGLDAFNEKQSEAGLKALRDKEATEAKQAAAMESTYGSEAEAFAAKEAAPKQAAAARAERLAEQIYNASSRMTGTQFTPDQSRETAKAALDLAGQGVNLNAAVQASMGAQLQAMQALAARIQQQQQQMQALGQGFGQVNRQIRQPGNWNGNPMGGE